MPPRLPLLLVLCTLAAAPAPAPAQDAVLVGRMDNGTYLSPTGEFRIAAPVLPELGGRITDTENVVTFSDDFDTHISIACFPQDALQKWELETRGLRDYLLYFFTDLVLADFQRRFPGSSIESARFLPELLDGALIAYALLPGGSVFEEKNRVLNGPPENPVTAKRGTLVFVRHGYVYAISTELAERATQRRTYQQTTEAENATLANRLTALAGRLVFTGGKPKP
ncbi:MAG: hypothetical protein JNG83_03640 [Opitutaceae bacterium]|nr:hypothetical protein [Opitutaceae bacterium]